jgi:hypothetical protein
LELAIFVSFAVFAPLREIKCPGAVALLGIPALLVSRFGNNQCMASRATNPLWKRFKAEKKAYDRLRTQTEANVVRWEHWSDFHWHWDPSNMKAEQIDSGALWRRSPPKQTDKKSAYYHYGFDSADRIVLIKRSESEDFIRYSGDSFAVSQFSDGVLMDLATGVMLNGQTVRVDKVGMSGEKEWMIVTWKENQPVRIVFGEYNGKADMEWLFTTSGKLIGMYDLPRKLPKGVNLNSLSRTIHERLMMLVPNVVAKCRLKQPAYCLILGYDGEGNGVMPPTVSIGLDFERKGWIQKNPRTARELIWNPDEFQHRLAKPRELPTDKKLEKACEWYNRILENRGSDTPARELLNRVAKALAASKWDDKLPMTDDFVVFAVDFEGGDLLKNMKKSVPAEVLKKLKANGLL